MFFLQSRYFCQNRHGLRTLDYFKYAFLQNVPRKYEPEYDKFGQLLTFETKFFDACFGFGTSCRLLGKKPWDAMEPKNEYFCEKMKDGMLTINSQVLDWVDHRKTYVYLRKMRSALVFLEEYIIPHDPELSSSLSWRLLKYEGISKIDEALSTGHYSGEFDDKPIDLRAVPRSHNWWTRGRWSFENSDEEFGECVVKESENPLLPLLEFNKFGSVTVPKADTRWPHHHLSIFKEIFERHLKLRHIQLHPISTFDLSDLTKEDYLRTFQCFNMMINWVFENPNSVQDDLVNPLILRSAIQFMEDDIVPFIEGAHLIWNEVLKGEGVKLLDELLPLPWKVPLKYRHLDNIPLNHTWWPEDYRQKPGKVSAIDVAFEVPRERVLAYLQFLSETPKDNAALPKIVEKFHDYFFDYANFCRKNQKDWAVVLGNGRFDQFRNNFSSSLCHLNVAEQTSISTLRRVRSSFEFLKEQELQNEELQKIMNGDAFKKLDKRLEEESDKRNYPILDVPKSHSWWPSEENRN